MADALLLLFGMIIGGVVFWASLRHLSNGVAALAASVPVQSAFAIHAGGREITWTKLVFAAVVAAWIVRIAVGASRPELKPIAIAFGLYVLALVISIIGARDIGAWAGEVYRWFVAWVVYLIAAEGFARAPQIWRVIGATCLGIVTMTGYAVWQVLSGAGPATFSIDGITRAYATFGEPNPFAAYLELTVLPLIAIGVASVYWRRRGRAIDRTIIPPPALLAILFGLIGVGALAITQSRGGYLGLAAGIATIIWLCGGRIRWVGLSLGAVGMVALMLSPLGGAVRDRFGADALSTGPTQVTVDNWAAQERAAHWRAAVAMAQDAPTTGVGAGNYNARFRESTTVWRFRIPRGHAHNAYLQSLAQAGLLGLVTYLGLIVVVIRELIRALNRLRDERNRKNSEQTQALQRGLVIGVAGVTAALMVHNLVDYLHVLSLGIQLSIVWAMLSIVHVHARPSSVPRVGLKR